MNHLRAQWRQAAQRVGRAQTISGSVVGLPADIDVTHASNFPGTGSVMLFREGRRIGYLDWSWSDRSNTVVILRAGIQRPEDRRKGYGTAMVEAIYEFNSWLRGSPIDTSQSGENTPAGNAFLRSLGAKGDYHTTGTCARCGQGTERGPLREWDYTGRLLHIYCHAKERAEQRV